MFTRSVARGKKCRTLAALTFKFLFSFFSKHVKCLLLQAKMCGRGACVLQFIPLPPEGSVATSLLTGRPAPSPLFNTGPSDGFNCHVKPSKLIAARREMKSEDIGEEKEDGNK